MATSAETARHAYQSLEPYHVVAYFNPGLRAAQEDLGLDAHAFYVGARAAPMGEVVAPVVAAAFYNFSPALIETAWPAALDAGLAEIDDRRYAMLDAQYRGILGDAAGLADLVPEYAALIADLPMSGRALAAAWAASDVPDAPALALWRHLSVLREWRGDNHIAELVRHGLDGVDAGVFHEAELPDPSISRRVIGRRFFQVSRGLSDADWDAAIDRLVARGLVERDGDKHRLTADGFALYQDIEAGTDAISGAAFGPAAANLIDRTRPYVKKVIDAGILPGTRAK
ncbi:hypothetical protein P0W64_21735 [Tsukamurella sp. 8F]|uniref:SCO6745 family protein n=1 Tax=unclassified Tsukamurella TaxID=2633480 RepID=UPI0023B96835|nr:MULTISPECIES: hypothetical protein [unclassified Tsukamurella]MDF0532522.1 hypothetical protein [Tsukamurella sp. 8J]MDF0589408.1 hypothetical protein [Tsukamurella sp. 8F]